ncbi:uncharacterized protein LOC132198822 [Neocloeon triangulifer]|uniref:uncharacterized protein LOC132198822 n=1 Tax=Neocloeon triangulifer TaxID=2078957 RepID=UPI00286F59F9|nr:uncharacterized protein LOC132198822 [Neocloeon triangulifer]
MLSNNLIFSSVFIILALCHTSVAQRNSCVDGYSCVSLEKFVYCDDASAEPMSCPKVGPAQTVCFGGTVGFGESSDEAGPCLKQPTCSQDGTFSVASTTGGAKIPELCSAYYKCSRTGLETNICDSGSEFSSKTGKCEPANLAGCSIRSSGGTSAVTETVTKDPNQDILETKAPNPKPASTTKAPPDFIPAEDIDYSYPDYEETGGGGTGVGGGGSSTPCRRFRNPDPSSCRHYILCTRLFGTMRRACPQNLYYNEALRVCTRNVDCGKRKK